MVGGTQPLQQQQLQQKQQQQPPQTPTSTAAAATTSAEEEALKRNTDCVYFLASPLTCKKGADCEYRHSDIARVNPRDCWYWLNGSCLNPKCAFRHPPLDGLLGTQVSTPVGPSLPSKQTLQVPSLPSKQTLQVPVTSAPYNSGKQAVPCVFFLQGYCLKGDRCPFLHAPSTVNKKVPQGPAATNVPEPPTLKKPFGGLQKCSQEQNFPQANVPKFTDLLSQGTPQAKVETAPPRNGVTFDRYLAPPPGLDDQPPRNRLTGIPPASNGDSMSRSNRVQQVHVSDDHDVQNSRDADEFSREPSPGFDVLVDDELRDSDYYHNEDHYGRTGSHEKRSLDAMNEYDIDHSAEYDSRVDVDRDMYRDSRGYDSYERMQGEYAMDKRRPSSERMLGGSAHLERRRYPRGDSPDQAADLRHHLSKQRRATGLRSVISHDRARDKHDEDRSYRGPSRRDAHHLPTNDSSVSSRLRGRIKLPGRSASPVNGSNLHLEREMDRGRNWGRLSPGIPQVSTHQGRLRDRIKGRVQEDIGNEGRSLRGPRMRDVLNDDNVDFAAPKSLAELKGGKITQSKELQMNDQLPPPLGKRKYPILENQQQSESDILFEGPKPLSEILKRKRVAETAVPGNGLVSGNKEVHNKKEETKSATADLVGAEENKSGQSPHRHHVSEIETEEGMIFDEPVDDHERETFDQKDGESDYEQIDGEDYPLDEAENAEAEEEFLDDEDGDDFAKKIGVMFS